MVLNYYKCFSSSALCLPESTNFLKLLITIVEVVNGNTNGKIACIIPTRPAKTRINELIKANRRCSKYDCGFTVSLVCLVKGLFI